MATVTIFSKAFYKYNLRYMKLYFLRTASCTIYVSSNCLTILYCTSKKFNNILIIFSFRTPVGLLMPCSDIFLMDVLSRILLQALPFLEKYFLFSNAVRRWIIEECSVFWFSDSSKWSEYACRVYGICIGSFKFQLDTLPFCFYFLFSFPFLSTSTLYRPSVASMRAEKATALGFHFFFFLFSFSFLIFPPFSLYVSVV